MLKELLIAFGIMGLCLVFHICGLVILGDRLVQRRRTIEHHARPAFAALLLVAVFTVVIVLHLAEAGLWAAFYRSYGLFQNFEISLYFSLASYSTIGYGDVLLPASWRLLGTIEGVSGALLCGLSTAFLFAIINALFRFRVQQLLKQRKIK